MSAAEEPLVSVADLVALARHPRLVGIGETGLDYHYTAESKAIQQTSLRIHIEAAQETGLPLIIHSRDADEDMEAILAEGMTRRPYSCVMHCFSSGPRLAEAAIEMGFTLSISGIAAFPKSQDLRDIFAKAPLDRLILETDSPYLAPPPYRGKRNEPAYVAHTARALAPAFGLSFEAFAAQTTGNFDRLFPRATRASKAA
jgi:TatD DNase family protein